MTPKSPRKSKPHRFLATIYKIWMMRHVDVPEEVARVLQRQLQSGRHNAEARERASKYIPVVAIVNGRSAQTTLVPAGGGRFRMQINTALRKAANVDAGDVVSVELRIDRASRDVPVPADFRASLKKHPKVQKTFETLTPAYRRHIVQWYDEAKMPETRQRRFDRIVDVLLERALLGARGKSG